MIGPSLFARNEMDDLTRARRARLYQEMRPQHLAPLWEVLHALVPPQPASPCVPAIWRYDELRPHLAAAGELITAEEAVRRVLILENPALPGQSAITQSLYAGMQLILPGERAPAHRHTQSALRFVIEGRGAHTSVDGERTTMHPGDFIITPAWTWHEHGNEGQGNDAGPVVWLDGLDIPMLRFFDAGFAENGGQGEQPPARPEGSSMARYGANMAPVGRVHARSSSPLFSYPYERTREALRILQRDEAPDPWHGFKLRYVNPATGGWPMPTLAAYMQLLPRGFAGKPQRSTDGTVYSVVEGSGSVRIGATRFEFAARDTFVVPSWLPVSFAASDDTVLFSFSDRPVQLALDILREEFLEA
jgi:gentisate 1,2-dioxygenase